MKHLTHAEELSTYNYHLFIPSPIGLVYVTRGWRSMRRISRHSHLIVSDTLNPAHIFTRHHMYTVPIT
jgi:hypothetical protein